MSEKPTRARQKNVRDAEILEAVLGQADPFTALRASVADQLRAARAHAGLSQRAVAAEAMTCQAQISYLERDAIAVSTTLRSIFAHAQACGHEVTITITPKGTTTP